VSQVEDLHDRARQPGNGARAHLQGERELADYNKSLGKLELHGIPPAPRGLPEIEVTFEIDANGIMHVRTKDLGTGKHQQSRIVAGGGLTPDEIESMVAEAEEFRDQDSTRREVIEARNRLEGLIYSTKRSLDEFGEALDPEDREIIKEALDAAKDALQADEVSVIQDAHEDLTMAAQRLAEAIYGGSATR
jgi:molecular chaperone DnaK